MWLKVSPRSVSAAVMNVGVAASIIIGTSASPTGALMKGEDQDHKVKTHSGHHGVEPPVATVGSFCPLKTTEDRRRHQSRTASHAGTDIGCEVTGPHGKGFQGAQAEVWNSRDGRALGQHLINVLILGWQNGVSVRRQGLPCPISFNQGQSGATLCPAQCCMLDIQPSR